MLLLRSNERRAVSQILLGAPRSDGTGPNPAAAYPPLYYAYGALAYEMSIDQSLLARLTMMRLAGSRATRFNGWFRLVDSSGAFRRRLATIFNQPTSQD